MRATSNQRQSVLVDEKNIECNYRLKLDRRPTAQATRMDKNREIQTRPRINSYKMIYDRINKTTFALQHGVT